MSLIKISMLNAAFSRAISGPETTDEEREYKAYKLRQIRTDVTAYIKALEKPEPQPKSGVASEEPSK